MPTTTNPERLIYFMKLIPLNTRKGSKRGGKYFVQVDNEDYDFVSQWNWTVNIMAHTCYAQRLDKSIIPHQNIQLHRFLLEITDPNIIVDHIDHNGLNCQRNNLRKCTKSENSKNRIGFGSSEFLGVSLHETKSKYESKKGGQKKYTSSKWRASIKIKDKYKSLGRFPLTPCGELLAALTYDIAAERVHGSFANFNFK